MAMSSQGDNDEVMSEINVTPLVDVMLVLLVVFIVTAPLLTNAIQVDLPETEQTQSPDDDNAVTVSVDAKGIIFVEKKQIAPEDLTRALQDLKLQRPDVSLFLQADDAARYGIVAKVMASIERSGVSRVSVITATE
ncbi:MAG: biopolymer transporter ExbD [Gammaproteobacteria bacterium]|nr:biopolymer transporter ExbD [Gammaproteobacteria bacterium]